jgi:heavy metal-binding protein
MVLSVALLAAVFLAGGPSGGPGTVRFTPGAYACPMHPQVRSEVPGGCPQCGMALVQMAPPGGPPYRVSLTASPAKPRPGKPVRLRFGVSEPTKDEPVRRFEIVHDMPFHLFIVSDDLEHYDHVHPELRDDGSLEIEIVLPAAGGYSLFCDFLPSGGTPQVVKLRLETVGAKAPPAGRAALVPDRLLSKTVDGIRFDLSIVPSPPAAGRVAILQFHLTDAITGGPVDDLEPYLAAWGHTLVLNDDATEYVHSHPVQMVPAGAARAHARGGPDVAFAATISTPGPHRAWAQFKRGGRVTTAPFTFDVVVPQHIARWDGTRWRALGDDGAASALDGPVHALAFSGDGLYAAGEFRHAGGGSAYGIARWDGKRWHALGNGLDGFVSTLAVLAGQVYAGGQFPGGVARWDGKDWHTVGTGIDGAVHVLAVVGDKLVAGGQFQRAGGVPAGSIASWDGARWTALGAGLKRGELAGLVCALATRDGELFAGGEFGTAGDTVAYNVARWDGTRWHALGEGLRGGLERVNALAVQGSDVVAGGEFTQAGEVIALRLAAWNGSAWRALDVATNETVRSLAAGPDLLVAGGAFSWAGGGKATGVVRRGGKGWSSFGEGVSGGAFLSPVLVVAPRAGEVYAGGGPFILR